MNDKDLKALNEKLLKFAGFKIPINEYDGKPFKKSKYPESDVWERPDKKLITGIDLPYLVNNPTDQLKWIYPKLYNLPESVHGDTTILIEWNSEYRQWYCQLNLLKTFEATDKEQPVAFALAVAQYIDDLEKHNGR